MRERKKHKHGIRNVLKTSYTSYWIAVIGTVPRCADSRHVDRLVENNTYRSHKRYIPSHNRLDWIYTPYSVHLYRGPLRHFQLIVHPVIYRHVFLSHLWARYFQILTVMIPLPSFQRTTTTPPRRPFHYPCHLHYYCWVMVMVSL